MNLIPHRARLLLAFAAVVVGSPALFAQQAPPDGYQFTYAWYSDGSPVSGSLSYAPGATFTLDVYIFQTAGATNFLTQEGGVMTAGVRANYGSPGGTPGVISVASPATDITVNPAFNETESSNTTRQADSNSAQFTAFTDASYGVLPDAQGKILLGQFKFTVSDAPAASSTVLTAEDIPSPSTDTITYSGGDFTYYLDPAISPASVTINVSPVPEPGWALAAAGAAALLTRLRRRSVPAARASEGTTGG
jgi:MYXO-CTERM domain-containing protein